MMDYSLALSVIHCSGADATVFLHDQISQSVQDLTPQQARLFNYCSPRGRILANGLVWKAQGNTNSEVSAKSADKEQASSNDQYYLLIHQSVAQSFLQRLQMFVLRAKVQLQLIDAQVIARTTTDNNDNGSAVALEPKDWSLPIYSAQESDHLYIQAPGLSQEPFRFWQINFGSPSENAPVDSIEPTHWAAQELETGWAWVSSATADVFLPQNLNQDIIPAVNFSKGCFPGQEVVARSHYRATIRRRAILVSSNSPSLVEQDTEQLAGTDIVTLNDEKPRIAGRVAAAVSVKDKTWALVETNLDFVLEKEPLFFAEHTETALHLEELPYQDQLPWEKKK